MRGYCPNCGQHIEALCDESPGLSCEQKAILELSKKVKTLEEKMRRMENEKKEVQ